MATDYDEDLYTWSQEQAALLRARQFDQIDLAHIVEEIEDMGKSEQRRWSPIWRSCCCIY